MGCTNSREDEYKGPRKTLNDTKVIVAGNLFVLDAIFPTFKKESVLLSKNELRFRKRKLPLSMVDLTGENLDLYEIHLSVNSEKGKEIVVLRTKTQAEFDVWRKALKSSLEAAEASVPIATGEGTAAPLRRARKNKMGDAVENRRSILTAGSESTLGRTKMGV